MIPGVPSQDRPIIVGGCHRSGTSLVRRILDAHPRIYCGTEVKFFRDFHDDYPEDPLRHLRFATSARAVLPKEELLEVLGQAFINLHERAAARAGKPRWADKNPENVLYLDDWRRLLGDEWVFVHVVRNPLDTLASIKEARFPLTIPADLEARIALYKRYVQAGLDFGALHPERYHRVLYERLVERPEPVVSTLMAWLEEDFEPVQLDFNKLRHQKGLEDPKVTRTTGVHAGSVGRWREILTSSEAEQISRECAALWRGISGGAGPHRSKGRLWTRLGSWASRLGIGGRTSEQEEGQRAVTASRPEGRSKEGALAPSPFIVGAARSGTTLLRLMLDAHPDLAIPPETHFIPQAARACESAPNPQRAFLETVTSSRRWKDYGIQSDLLARRIYSVEPFDLGEALRAFYKLYAERFGKPRWGDKTPPYVDRMDVIQDLLPEARFIHVVRDGRDVALSSMGLWFGPDSIEEAARRWRAVIEKARRQSRKLPHYLEIRYEDLVSNTEPALRKVSNFVGLPWDRGMLAYHETAEERLSEIQQDIRATDGGRVIRGEERRAIHSLTNRPPQRDRIGRWRQEMTVKDRERFEELAGETLRGLGYGL